MIGNLLKNPLSGGMPASDTAAMKNDHVNTGCDLISPPISLICVVPVTFSVAPANRNNAVFTNMWWTM